MPAFDGRRIQAGGPAFNTRGNILIADQFNNRVIEINPNTHDVVWKFGDGSSKPGPKSVVGSNDAERVGNLTLIAGTGAPPNSEPTCPPPNGCPDNRVMLVNEDGKIVWQYGQAGVSGSGPNELNTPVQNTFLPNGNIMITDQVNERVIVVTLDKEIVWQYPTIPDPNLLNSAAFASRLPDGNTLITDSDNNRIIEVTETGTVVFSYSTLDPAGNLCRLGQFACATG